jgi:hypothetical protein
LSKRNNLKEINFKYKMNILVNSESEKISWNIFKEFDLVRIRTDTDGSCFFHAICKAYFKPYIVGKIDNEFFDRKQFIHNLRKDLSKKLGLKINPEDPNSKTYYAALSRGEIENFSKEMPEYLLENMQKELGSSTPISNIYNEFISNQLNIDIYILDAKNKDVYMTGGDDKLLYKNRKSVVILYMPGHYELIGLLHNDKYVETYFDPNSSFILKIRERMNELREF